MPDDRTGHPLMTSDELGKVAYLCFHGGTGCVFWERLDPTTRMMWVRAAEAVKEALAK